MLVSRIDIGAQLQQALQTRQALGLLTGEVQGAALVDLSPETPAGLALGPPGCSDTHTHTPARRQHPLLPGPAG